MITRKKVEVQRGTPFMMNKITMICMEIWDQMVPIEMALPNIEGVLKKEKEDLIRSHQELAKTKVKSKVLREIW